MVAFSFGEWWWVSVPKAGENLEKTFFLVSNIHLITVSVSFSIFKQTLFESINRLGVYSIEREIRKEKSI